jgi:alpha-beta hydrolase superfamily lysophospholipase
MRRLLGKLTGLFAIWALLLISQLATTNVVAGEDLIVDEIGVLDGVTYKIKVPEKWNETLLMYAHGYHRSVPPTLVPFEIEIISGSILEEGLLARGYALAASSYRNAGWAVKEGIEDTKDLTEYFSELVKKPKRTILWGSSMGSAVALKSIEEHPDIYDGAIVLSHLGAGTSSTFDMTLAIALAYDVALGWPKSWGNVGDVRDDLDFEAQVAPILTAQVYDLSDPSNPTLNQANFGKFEFLRLVNRLPEEGFYEGVIPLNLWLFGDMFFATGARAELETRAGGPVAQNLNHTYTLSEYDKAYLASLGVNADKLLSKMNKQTVIAADPLARNYLKEYADFSGKLERPVLTLQPKGDGMTVPANSTVYQETVEASGALDLLVQKYTEGNMHVVFTPKQVYAAFKAMKYWLNTGTRPNDNFFPTAIGFDNNYIPQDWPQLTE